MARRRAAASSASAKRLGRLCSAAVCSPARAAGRSQGWPPQMAFNKSMAVWAHWAGTSSSRYGNATMMSPGSASGRTCRKPLSGQFSLGLGPVPPPGGSAVWPPIGCPAWLLNRAPNSSHRVKVTRAKVRASQSSRARPSSLPPSRGRGQVGRRAESSLRIRRHRSGSPSSGMSDRSSQTSATGTSAQWLTLSRLRRRSMSIRVPWLGEGLKVGSGRGPG